MNFVSVRIITDDIKRLVSFYERITRLTPTWFTEDFAEVATPGGTLAIGSLRTMELFGKDAAQPRSNQSVIIEFLVEDVDAKYEQLQPLIADLIQAPTTMPWGNRSLLFRDPDGNLVNFFTPVTPQARKKFQLD